MSISEEILQEGKTIQGEIKHLLTETISLDQFSDPLTQNSTRRRKELASFMGKPFQNFFEYSFLIF